VSESGRFTGGIAQDVTRGVGDAMREVERALTDLERKVPHDVGDRLARLGRRISDVVDRAMERAERRRERHDSPKEQREPDQQDNPARPEFGGDQDDTLLKILKAVREGTIKPEEADGLISAWIELRRATRDEHAE
jgi:hypothetical protein